MSTKRVIYLLTYDRAVSLSDHKYVHTEASVTTEEEAIKWKLSDKNGDRSYTPITVFDTMQEAHSLASCNIACKLY